MSLHIYPQPPPQLLQPPHRLENRHSTQFNFEARQEIILFTREVKGGGVAEAHITVVAQTDKRADLLLPIQDGRTPRAKTFTPLLPISKTVEIQATFSNIQK